MIPFPFQAGQLGLSAAESDPYFSSVSLLLHGNGPNGSTTIYDSSSTHKTGTRFGDLQISTAQSKFTDSSIACDGTGDAYLYAFSTDHYLNGDFTIEAWVYPTISTGFHEILCHGGGSGIAWASFELVLNGLVANFAGSSANTGYDIGSESTSTGQIGTLTVNAWNHLAVTRSGNVYRGFLNGVQGYTQTLALTPYNPTPRGVCIAANFATTWGTGTPTVPFQGYLQEVRITKGVARYTSNFTPSSAPFPNS